VPPVSFHNLAKDLQIRHPAHAPSLDPHRDAVESQLNEQAFNTDDDRRLSRELTVHHGFFLSRCRP